MFRKNVVDHSCSKIDKFSQGLEHILLLSEILAKYVDYMRQNAVNEDCWKIGRKQKWRGELWMVHIIIKYKKKIFNVFVNIPKNFDKYKVKGNLTYSWKSHQSMFFFVADIFLILWGCWPKKWHLTYFSVSQDYTYESPSISQVQNTHFTTFKVWMKRCKELKKSTKGYWKILLLTNCLNIIDLIILNPNSDEKWSKKWIHHFLWHNLK